MTNDGAKRDCVFQSKSTQTTTQCRNPKVANGAEIPLSICANCPLKTMDESELEAIKKHANEWDNANDKTQGRFPSLFRQAWNFTKAVGRFVSDGMRTVSKEEYENRLRICDKCEYRRGNRCLKCGCGLQIKAKGRAFDCPIGKWPEPDEE